MRRELVGDTSARSAELAATPDELTALQNRIQQLTPILETLRKVMNSRTAKKLWYWKTGGRT